MSLGGTQRPKATGLFCWSDCAMEIPTGSELERGSARTGDVEGAEGERELPALPT